MNKGISIDDIRNAARLITKPSKYYVINLEDAKDLGIKHGNVSVDKTVIFVVSGYVQRGSIYVIDKLEMDKLGWMR